MLRKIRISIAGLMGVVLVAALAFAALRNSSESWAGLMLMLTCGVLTLGLVGAVCRGPHERAWWLGFTLFGGGYMALAHAMAFSPTPLPTITLAEIIGSGLGVTLDSWTRPGIGGWNSLGPPYRILHCLWALALALLGYILAGLLVAGPAVAAPKLIGEVLSETRSSCGCWTSRSRYTSPRTPRSRRCSSKSKWRLQMLISPPAYRCTSIQLACRTPKRT